MKGFWQEFIRADNSVVHTPYAAMAIAFILAAPIVMLSCAAIIDEVFIMHRAIDGPIVNLLLGMLGSATGGVIGAGVSTFARTNISQVSHVTEDIMPGEGKGNKPE